MATRNRHESIAPEYQLSADGQLSLRAGERGWPPIRTAQLADGRATARSQAERDVELELRAHQMPLPSFKNVTVETTREHADRTFFGQTIPAHVEMPPPTESAVPAEAGTTTELSEPAEADTVIEFPAPTAKTS